MDQWDAQNLLTGMCIGLGFVPDLDLSLAIWLQLKGGFACVYKPCLCPSSILLDVVVVVG